METLWNEIVKLAPLWWIIIAGIMYVSMRFYYTRFKKLEDKTSDMNCREHEYKIKSHGKDVEKLDAKYDRLSENLISVRADVSEIKATIKAITQKDRAGMFGSQSPLNLTQTGEDFVKKYHVETLVNNNWQGILDCLSDIKTTNPYDIQTKIFGKCFDDMDKLIGYEATEFLKRYAFNTGETFTTIGMVVGLVIRNKYFEEKHIDINEIDIHDPSKILEKQDSLVDLQSVPSPT